MIRTLTLAVALMAGPALAHPGDHSHATLGHIIAPDHLALLLAALLLAITGGGGLLLRAMVRRRGPR